MSTLLERVQSGELCARCGGLGEIRPAGSAPDETEVCPVCQGTGRTNTASSTPPGGETWANPK